MKRYSALLLVLLVWGQSAGAPPDWSADPAAYELSASATAVLYLDFVAVEGGDNRVAAFVGDECRGVAAPVQALDSWFYFITLLANISGETVHFKAYLAASDQVVDLQQTVSFESNQVYGRPDDPLELHAILNYDFPPVVHPIPDQAIEQGQAFAPIALGDYLEEQNGDPVGWTYSRDSFYLEVEISAEGVATVRPSSPEWIGTGQVTFTAVDQTASGRSGETAVVFTVVPQDHPPQIGHIPDQTIGLGGRFAPIRFADFLAEVDGDPVLWEYRFQTVLQSGNPPAWSADPAAYELSMTVTAAMVARGEPVPEGEHRLGAFVGVECRGVAAPVAGLYFLTVHASTHGEEIRFLFFDARTGEVLPVREQLSFTPNAAHGSPSSPFALSAGYLHVVIDEGEEARVEVVDPAWFGTETVELIVRDQGTLNEYADWTVVEFTVLDDHQPVVDGIPDQTVEAGQGFAVFDLDDFLIELDGDPVTWRVSGNSALQVEIDAENQVTVSPPDPGWTGSESLVFTALDALSLQIEALGHEHARINADTAVFAVVPVDHPPQLGVIPDQTIGLGGRFAPIALAAYLTEEDGDETRWRVEFPLADSPTPQPTWEVRAADYELSMNVAAVVAALGREKGDGDHLLGAFVGTECRGVAAPLAALDRWVYFLPIYARANGEEIEFRFFDGEAGEIFPVGQTATFEANAVLGRPADPVELQAGYLQVDIDAGGQATVGIVNPDWSGAEIVDFIAQDVNTLHEYGIGSQVTFTIRADHQPQVGDIPDQMIEQGEGFAVFDLGEYLVEQDGDLVLWSASGAVELLVGIDAENRVSVTLPDADWMGSEVVIFTATDDTPYQFWDADEVRFTVGPVDHPPVVGGIPDQAVRQQRAFLPFDLDDYLTEVDGDPVTWSFAFPQANPPAPLPSWSVQEAEYERSMTVTAAVSVQGLMMPGEGQWLAAFAPDPQDPQGPDLCRGVAQPVQTPAGWRFFLTLHGNLDGEEITFWLYDAESGREWPVQEKLPFTAEAAHGSPLQPLVLHAGYLQFAVDAENRVSVAILDSEWTGSEVAIFRAADQETAQGHSGEAQVAYSVLPGMTVYGDANGDEAVNALDVAWILQHAVAMRVLSGADSVAADVNGSAAISPFDAALVLKYVVGMIDEFPVESGGTGKIAMSAGRVWLGTAVESGGMGQVVPVLADGMEGVVAGELVLSGVASGTTVRTTPLTAGCLVESRVENGRMRVVFAGAEPRSGAGPLLELAVEGEDSAQPGNLRLERAWLNDTPVQVGAAVLPAASRLWPNYPNPFNAATTIRYEVSSTGPVRLQVYALNGQRVRILVAGIRPAGRHEVAWDGRDEAGFPVASGAYLCRLEAGPYRAVGKLLLAR